MSVDNVELVKSLRILAVTYEEAAVHEENTTPTGRKICSYNAEMYRLAADAIESLMARLVRQACYYEQIEAQEND